MLLTRKALITLGICLCAPIGFAMATEIAGDHAPPPPQPAQHGVLEPGQLAGVRGSESVEQVTRDPRGEGQDWGITVFKSKGGQTCVARGRKVGKKVGEVDPDGRFTEYPIEDGATCVDLTVAPAGAQVTTDTRIGRTTVHGLAGPTVKAISVTANGVTEPVLIGPRGGFLHVLGPEILAPSDGRLRVQVTATLKDGSTLSLID